MLCEGNQLEVGGWHLTPDAQRLARTAGHKADERGDS